MSQNTQWDSLDYDVLDFGYDRTTQALSPKPRIVDGVNTYVTRGGALAKRPGTIPLDGNCTVGGRIDKLWLYETMETSPNVYILATVYVGGLWRLYYKRLQASAVTSWVPLPISIFRSIAVSTVPHEIVISRGLAYVKSISISPLDPADLIGAAILDGTGGTIVQKYWGIFGPTEPAHVAGAKTTITADVTAIATSIDVVTTAGLPAAPYDIQIGYEQLTVTVVAGNTLTVTRGANATTAVAHVTGEAVLWLNWAASDHLIEVNNGWSYTYAYKSLSGQVSNRASIEKNPDKLPSNTGPFFDLVPKITVQGNADTVNVPTICIYRTTDGGGTFYKLEEITNTGAGAIVYYDDSAESGAAGGTFNDPIPDAVLDQFDIAPSLVSNSPPPSVIAPDVTGVDPAVRSTPLVSFQSRIWYGIGNILFFSAQEELNEGIPEESFPSGSQNGRSGNFYRLQYPISNLAATTNSLYIFTPQVTYRLNGNNLETFNITTAFENVGMPLDQREAVVKFNETIAFLTQDYRIGWIRNDQLEILSNPLNNDLVDAFAAGGTADLEYHGDTTKNWIIVDVHNDADTSLSRQWVYDIDKSAQTRDNFWFSPWTIRSVATLASRTLDTSSRRKLIIAVYNGTNSSLVTLAEENGLKSDNFMGTPEGYEISVDFHQMLVPPGNHVNSLRVPGSTPTVYGVTIDRIKYTDDTDPDMEWFFDDLWTAPETSDAPLVPQRRNPSLGFTTNHFTIHRVCQHFSLRLSKDSSTEAFELDRLTVIWDPDAGC